MASSIQTTYEANSHLPLKILLRPQRPHRRRLKGWSSFIPTHRSLLQNRSYPFRMPLRSGDLPFKALDRLFPPQRARCPTGTSSSCSLLGSANPHRNVAASQMAFLIRPHVLLYRLRRSLSYSTVLSQRICNLGQPQVSFHW